MSNRFAVLMDGGFATKRLRVMKGRGALPVGADEVVAHVLRLTHHERLESLNLFRLYYYDALPYDGKSVNPISKKKVDFSKTAVASQGLSLLDALELSPDVAVRRGVTVMSGWKLGSRAMSSLMKKQRPITAPDLEPNIRQKGVDLRIGLDMASIALKRIVGTVVLVSGDADLIPAMKFARKEGIRVYLDPMGSSNVSREMRVHADFVF